MGYFGNCSYLRLFCTAKVWYLEFFCVWRICRCRIIQSFFHLRFCEFWIFTCISQCTWDSNVKLPGNCEWTANVFKRLFISNKIHPFQSDANVTKAEASWSIERYNSSSLSSKIKHVRKHYWPHSLNIIVVLWVFITFCFYIFVFAFNWNFFWIPASLFSC